MKAMCFWLDIVFSYSPQSFLGSKYIELCLVDFSFDFMKTDLANLFLYFVPFLMK